MSHYYRCDGPACNEMAPCEVGEIRKGWIQIQPSDDGPSDFCSWDCLITASLEAKGEGNWE